MSSAGVMPKNAVGIGRSSGARTIADDPADEAAVSIMPSMPMLTTPDRSHMTPHSAASAIGMADCEDDRRDQGRTSMR